MSSDLPSRDSDYQAPPAPAKMVFDRSVYNHVLGDIALRLNVIEAQRTDLQAVIDDLRLFGLQRLDEAIVPLIDDTEAQIAALQQQVADTAAANAQIIEDFQQVTAVNLEELSDAVTAAENSLADVQDQIDIILAGGIPADKVAEDATRVFVTPEERARLQSLMTVLDGGTFG